jgi:hypothetical protein
MDPRYSGASPVKHMNTKSSDRRVLFRILDAQITTPGIYHHHHLYKSKEYETPVDYDS